MPSNEGQKDEEILAAVRALQAGAGPEAFDPIALHFLKPLLTFFANRSDLRQEASDLAQDTLVRAYENIYQYRFEAAFDTWIRKIAENVWKNAMRNLQAAKRKADVESLDAIQDEGESEPLVLQVPDLTGSPEQEALAWEKAEALRAAVEALPPGMRKCMELQLYADLKYREIAELTGIGLNSVRSQLFEARQRLKPVLEEYFPGADF